MNRRGDPITVAMIIQRYYPHLGGAENQLMALAPRLLERGVRPLIVTRRLTGTAKAERLDGVPVYRLPARGPKPVAGLEFIGRASTFLARGSDHIDVLHAHELLSPATVGLGASWLSGRPLVVKVLRGGALSDLRALRRRPLGGARWRSYRRFVDRFIAVSAEIDHELRRAGVPTERIVRIPNGVDAITFCPVEAVARRALRRELGVADVPTAVFAGRLSPEKRVKTLVEVWPGVRGSVPDAQLLIIGEGPEQAGLERLAGAGVQVLGLKRPVTPYLQAGDVFALPSVAEGLSNALLEAMACGLACVAHPHGGAADLIEDGRSGRLLPNASEATLASVLIELLSQPIRSRQLGQAARQTILADYTLERTADRLVELYRQLVSTDKRGQRCAESPA